MQTRTSSYKAFEINSFGFNGINSTDKQVPTPTGTQVLVKIKAVSLNFRDLMMVKGIYNKKLQMPLIPLSDGAGEVVAIGPDVSRWQPGNRVMPTFMQTWLDGAVTAEHAKSALGGAVDGVLQEFALFDEQGLVSIPEHLSYEEGATLPCAAVTAWNALVTSGGVKAGDKVLVLGSGGVSTFALQIAKICGAQVIATSSSDDKLQRLKQLGASEGINYKQSPDWDKNIIALTGGTGVDQIVEVGGSGTFDKSLKSIRMGGYIAMIGVLSAGQPDLIPVLMKSVKVQGIFVGSRKMFEEMNTAFSLHKIHPVIDKVFKVDNIKEALEYLESGRHFGKVVLTF